MASNFVSCAATRFGDLLISSIRQRLGYLIHYNTNIDRLRNEVARLKNFRDAKQLLVDEAKRKGEIILPDVEAWLKEVNKLTEEAETFLNEEIHVNERCLGLCPNLNSRYQKSKKAKKKTLAIDERRRDGMFGRVSSSAPPPRIASISMKDLEVFESRKSTFDGIMEALKDDKINMIGIWGMGGIGKTTIVKEVAKQAEREKLFDEIVMLVVSQTPNVRNIQGEIAEMLGLMLTGESEIVRAGRLCERLKKEKKILVILDDLWARLDLENIGIPHGYAHKGCKIVLTTRSQDVCSEMNTQVNFLIGVLSELEAWNLFRETVGEAVDLPDLLPIATDVTKECAGLPIAIVTVAMALKGKSKHAWSDALRQLRTSSLKNIKGMHANVYSSLELSYNSLESEEVQYIFLLCCLFPEDFDISIEYLVIYGMGLSLFENVHNLEEARDRAHSLVDDLKASCLLLDGKAEGSIRMHDVVRDFALSVACKGQYKFLVRIGAGLKEWPKIDTFAHHTAIALLCNKFHQLPDGLDCPKLNW
uniref:NB-ARC domain-containing protein n=1 Tax=Davidia involucrata TaxID=16924 RepID=A0A5B6YZW5_DAVIN